uniref:NAC domain-containing protein n=1 Tax=Ananas comosus var. bracteatus TaxID=296719 RepID=A0A6V7Q3U0_ANACO|nr:unnamed protein product [Ananas comosus var. bracteatus]
MVMLPGYKFTPSEEFLVGDLLRKRLRGEPLEGAAASWCKLIKAKKAHRGGRADQEGRQGKNRRKERTVRRDGRVEIGQWRSTQAVKKVIHIDDLGCAVVIGYHQNFEYRDSKKQKSEWLMEEYGVLPPLEDASGEDKELVICKIYKTPAARRAEAKRSAGSSPASPIPSPVLPSQHSLPQQQPAWTELLQPPPFGPSPPAVVPPNQPNVAVEHAVASILARTGVAASFFVGTITAPLSARSPAATPAAVARPGQLPPLHPQQDMPQYNIAMTEDTLSDASFSPDDYQFASDGHRGIIDASAETLQPPLPPAVVVNPQPHAVSVAHVGDDRTPADSQSSQCTTTAKISEHHADNGGVLSPPNEQQQQQQPPPLHAELNATARTRPIDLQLLERSAKRRNILGTHNSLFVSSSPRRPTVRRAPTSAR